VEATLENSESLEITETGEFRGTLSINDATIAGVFEGNLTARERLTIKSTGRIKGTIRYGQIEIELGGEIDGDVHQVAPGAASGSPESNG